MTYAIKQALLCIVVLFLLYSAENSALERAMISKLRLWRQQIKQHLVPILVIVIILIVAIALIIAVVLSNGTGFDGYTKVTTAHIISGPSTGTVTRTEEYLPGKALWDWLQLLIIPIMLAIGGYWLNQIQKDREQRATEERVEREKREAEQRAKTEREAAENHAQAEREISFDNQREAALKEYIDKISELLLHENLGKSEPGSEVRKIARVRTLTVLPPLDPERKGSVLLFLTESGLIHIDDPIIDLFRADLSRVQLYKPWLNEINLHETNLSEANLYEADLLAANLSKADLYGAHLVGATLPGVNLREANLLRADIHGAALLGADLSGAELSEADLQRTYLENADLSKATMRAANLSGANLRKANLRGAILNGANLHRAKLADADLSEATLYGANILPEQLEQAKSLKGATMPDGSTHP